MGSEGPALRLGTYPPYEATLKGILGNNALMHVLLHFINLFKAVCSSELA